MRTEVLKYSRYENFKQTFVLLFSMMTLMFLLGWILAGMTGVVLVSVVSISLFIVNGYHSPQSFLRAIRARVLRRNSFPELYSVIQKLARRAGLSHMPLLYCVPSKVMNAFVVGKEENSAIVVTDSLLRNLNLREIAGILGHEIAHIRNKDLWVMSLAGATVRIMHFLSTLGQLLILLTLPAMFTGDIQIAFLPLFLLLFAPTIGLMLMMALSRTREYEADRMGVELVGDVYGLVSALEKLERYHKGLFHRFFLAPWKLSQPSFLQTHPPTKERIERLVAMSDPGDGWQVRFPWQHRLSH